MEWTGHLGDTRQGGSRAPSSGTLGTAFPQGLQSRAEHANGGIDESDRSRARAKEGILNPPPWWLTRSPLGSNRMNAPIGRSRRVGKDLLRHE